MNINKLKYILVSFISTIFVPSILFAQTSGSSSSSSSGASTPTNIGDVFKHISESMTSIPSMIMGVATIAGLGFAVASIFKFKQHKDAPQQTPLGQPIALLGFGVMLIWLPFLLQSLGTTISGKNDKSDKSGIGGSTPPDWIQNQ